MRIELIFNKYPWVELTTPKPRQDHEVSFQSPQPPCLLLLCLSLSINSIPPPQPLLIPIIFMLCPQSLRLYHKKKECVSSSVSSFEIVITCAGKYKSRKQISNCETLDSQVSTTQERNSQRKLAGNKSFKGQLKKVYSWLTKDVAGLPIIT